MTDTARQKTTFGSIIKKLCSRWFIDAFSGMAQGLFVTLIAGTIVKQLGVLLLDVDTAFVSKVGQADVASEGRFDSDVQTDLPIRFMDVYLLHQHSQVSFRHFPL